MGMTFDVNVDVKTRGKEAIDQLEKQIEKLKNNTVNIKVDLTGNGTDFSKYFSDIQKQAQNVGKTVAANLQQGIQQGMKSNKFDSNSFLKEYIEKENKNLKESESVAKKFNTTPQTALKAVRARNSAEIKANNESIAQQKQLQKEIDTIEKARLQSIENARKREEKITSQQNKAINRSLENDYKQQLKEAEETAKQHQKNVQSASDNYWKQEFDNQFQTRHMKSPELENMKQYYQEQLKQAEETAKQISKIQDNVFNGSYFSKSSTMTSKLSPYTNQNNDLLKTAREQAKLYDDTLQKLKDHFDSKNAFKLDDSEVISSFETMDDAAKKFDNTMTQIRNIQSKDLGLGVAERSANSVRAYYEANSKAIKKYGTELKDLESRYRNIKTVEEKLNLDNEYKNLQAKISAEGLTGKSFLEELGSGFKQIGQFASIYGAIQRIPEVISRMYQEVTEVDTAMTNLYKVTDETSATYDKFLNNAGTTAKSLGRDMSSYITQTSEWAKLGYSMMESSELSKLSSIYANVGEVDDKTAVSDMVTAMKAFNIESSNAVTIIDSLNALGNNFATSSADLGEGLSKSASSMKTAGSDIHETLAMLTGGAEITQNAGEFGNFLKVASMRIRGMKGELEQLGEEVDPAVDSISKVQTQILNLTKGKVNIFDSNNEFRNYYKIMEEIASIHDELSSTDQASLDEILFGKQRANQGAALLQAFQSGQIQKALETSINSEGSAQEEQERWLDSIEAKTQQMSAAFQELSTTVINSSFAKVFLDFGTGSLDVLTQIIDKLGTFKTLISSIGGGWLTKHGFGKINRNAALYKIKQNNRRFINVETSLAS